MPHDKNLHFIINKIEDINVALFRCEGSSVLKIPTAVANTYQVDEDGSIYFFLPRPKQLLCEFEKQFPVVLNYFRKGVPYYLNIHGSACIISDPEELYCYNLSKEEMEQAMHKEVFVKVKIITAEYYTSSSAKNTVFTKVKSFFYNLLTWVQPRAKSYRFRTANHQIHNYGF